MIDSSPISDDELISRRKMIDYKACFYTSDYVVRPSDSLPSDRTLPHYGTRGSFALVLCSAFVYAFAWHQPQNIAHPVLLELLAPSPEQKQSRWQQFRKKFTSETRKTHRIRFEFPYVPGWLATTGTIILLVLFSCGFGATHCLAWHSSLPTVKERLAWRICSVTITALPAIAVPLLYLTDSSGMDSHNRVFLFMDAIYIIGRITIISLAFASLRVLPADVFHTVDWNTYIPHIAT